MLRNPLEGGGYQIRQSTRGHPFWVWERRLPRISDRYLQCVAYLYPSVSDAEAGRAIGGTAFIVSKLEPNGVVPGLYVVTNRHVIEGGHTVIRGNKADGGVDFLETDERQWIFHPSGDDLAIHPILYDPRVHPFVHIGSQHFLTHGLIERYSIGPGDDVFTVGRFVSQEGRQRNLPTVRFGNIAQMPGEPVRDYRPSGPFDQESFLVEARSLGGYSGAPVFVQILPASIRPGVETWEQPHNILCAHGPWLLGVNWAHMNDFVPTVDHSGRTLDFKVRSNSGMMAVVPAWKLEEMLNMPDVKRSREMVDQAIRERDGPPAATPTAVDESPEAEERFRRTVGNLLKTPPAPKKTKPGGAGSEGSSEPSA